MIKNFNDFLNEAIKYSQLMKFGIEEFEASDMKKTGEIILKNLESNKYVLIDANGDEDEYEVFNRLIEIVEQHKSDKWYIVDEIEDSIIISIYTIPILGKCAIVSRVPLGTDPMKAVNMDIEKDSYMFFFKPGIDVNKFMDDTRGFHAGKKYGV